MRNNEPLHPLQQCLRDNGEQIAEAIAEAQFREVLAVNAELRAEVEKLKQDCRNYLHEVEQLRAQQGGWIPVSERLPEGTVLASYTNNYNKSRIIRAKYVQKFTQESEDIDNFDAQYDEETDTYYDCEGWYELIDNWGDYSSVAVTEGTVTHWMPLPAAPKGGDV